MIETREKSIEGSTYQVTQLPARRAIRLKAKLIKLFGPAFAQMYIANSANGPDIAKAIEILSSSIDENTFEALIVEVLNGVRKNGVELTPPVIDLEFAGYMATLYQVVWFVLEVNFSNFFQMMGIGALSNSQEKPADATLRKTFTRTS